ncbi:MAG: RNA 2',3'-cyclic phosphodiesterase [Pseudomonadota bacterium]
MKPLNMVRTFIEVRLSQATHRNIIDFLARKKPLFEKGNWIVRWVHPDNVHITLRFIGDMDAPLVSMVKERLQRLSQINAFGITVKGLGAFPSFGSPRVIWVGIEDEKERLGNLAARINDELGGLGFKSETRKFRPHVTIGRVARRGSVPLVDLIGDCSEEPFGEDEVKECIFMKSVLTTERAVHTPLFSVAFIRRRSEPRREERREKPREEPEEEPVEERLEERVEETREEPAEEPVEERVQEPGEGGPESTK